MTNRHFSYPLNLDKDESGGYVATFTDLPEAITQGESIADALHEAIDCLEEAIANRIVMKLPIPNPTQPKKNQHCISFHTTLIAKVALYLAMQEESLNNTSLARKLHCDEKEVRRLLDPYYTSKLPRIEYALEKLGRRLDIGVVNL